MKKKYLLSLILGIICSYGVQAQSNNEALWLRYPAISPDGSIVLFNYKGDIYMVETKGGTAYPLTLSESYEYNPIWSSDGNHIAFASNRYGNFDVFSMPATGGEAKRLTYHSYGEVPTTFSPDGNFIYFTGLRQDDVNQVQFPSGGMPELYRVPTDGGKVDQVMSTAARNAVFAKDGRTLLYHDVKGYENNWRKHHTSAVTRDVWSFNLDTKIYQQLSSFKGEDRNPVPDADGIHYYYLSEKSGSFNVHKGKLNDPAFDQQLTTYSKHPVRFLSISNNNTLSFSYHGELYTLKPGSTPTKIPVRIAFDGRSTLPEMVSVRSGMNSFDISPNGKEVAFGFRGELFVTSMDHGTTKRITNTAYQERNPVFSPDGRSLVYAAEKGSSWDVHQTSLAREEENYFYAATTLSESVVIATDMDEFQPSWSPDGKEVAYLEDRQTLKVINLDTKQSRTVLPYNYNYSYADGDQWYQWSPDGSWFVVSFGSDSRIFFGEVGLVKADGTGEVINLTKSGYSEFGPKWAMNGQAIVYGSDREGMRTENDWQTGADVYAIFLTKEAFDRFNLSKEDLELVKELEEKQKEAEEKKEEEPKKKSKKKKAEEKPVEGTEKIKIDWEGLEDRKVRLTTHTSNANDWLLSDDGDALYYLTRFEGGYDLWKTDLKTKETSKFAGLGAPYAGMDFSKDKDFIMVISPNGLTKVTTADGSTKNVSVNGEMVLKRDGERAYIFDHAWRQIREKFYVQDLQGVDWDFYYTEYKKFLPYINNNYDFAEMLSEMLGELNASHTGSGFRYREPMGDQTASLGVLYDYTYEGNGVRIAEILAQGPMDRAGLKVKAGHIITAIDGTPISEDRDFYALLNRKKGDRTLLSLKDPATGRTWDEVIRPYSIGEEREALYQRWVKSRRAEVERLSNGRLGYVHVRSMNDASMRVVFEEALGRYIDAEGLVVDTRFNGGGNLHDRLSDFLTGERYMDVIPHGQYVGFEPFSKYTRPSIVVMSESNYSDAHLFPIAYKMKDGGKTVGMPVPGTGTFVWWETQIDPSIYFGVPMGGWKPVGQDAFLENTQMEPDIKVPNEPGMLVKGKDQQLEVAVTELLKDIDSNK